jgi:hypothetical protein
VNCNYDGGWGLPLEGVGLPKSVTFALSAHLGVRAKGCSAAFSLEKKYTYSFKASLERGGVLLYSDCIIGEFGLFVFDVIKIGRRRYEKPDCAFVIPPEVDGDHLRFNAAAFELFFPSA